jgi:hypothetical protein
MLMAACARIDASTGEVNVHTVSNTDEHDIFNVKESDENKQPTSKRKRRNNRRK